MYMHEVIITVVVWYFLAGQNKEGVCSILVICSAHAKVTRAFKTMINQTLSKGECQRSLHISMPSLPQQKWEMGNSKKACQRSLQGKKCMYGNTYGDFYT